MNLLTETAPKYAGADWLESMRTSQAGRKKPKPLSPLAKVVADIVGQVWKGIYHVPGITDGEWTDLWRVSFRIDGDISTYDSDYLTNLVILCHDAAIRLEISAVTEEIEDEDDPDVKGSMARLQLSFGLRQRGGRYWQHHPAIEDAVIAARNLGGPGWAESMAEAVGKRETIR